ncbi:hypothetical protein HN51_066779 [Arachis hypogaea]|uniref:pentatricopeptide repeat-containing protein At4g11690-like n=1 Tax=Arachis ipaensis TaxID=130454 RepID=UPI000A2B0B71|nr:pentatricopeptide repeat-containing protein At4g11690-like [Arachis ipaensis]
MCHSYKALVLIQKMVKVPPTKALSLFNSLNHHHTPQSISFILNHLLSSAMLSHAHSLLLRLISSRISSPFFSPSSLMHQLTHTQFIHNSTHTLLYEAIINAYVHSHLPDQALCFLNHMVRNAHFPTSNTFNNLLILLLRSNCFGKAWLLFNEIKGKVAMDVYSFGIMIKGCCEVGDLIKSFRLLALLIRMGFSPNVVLYTTLIDGCCKIGDVHLAKKLFCKMEGLGLVPNQHTYSVLINRFFKQGLQKEAFLMYENMKQRGTVPNVYAYNCIIKEYCKDGNVDKAFKVFNEMREKGVAYGIVTYNILIDGLCRLKKLQEAVKLVDKVYLVGLTPNLVTYNTLINGFVALERWTLLLDYLINQRQLDYRHHW